MKGIARIDNLYKHPLSVLIQLGIACLVLFEIITQFDGTFESVKIFIFLLSLFAMTEVFFKNCIDKTLPSATIASSDPEKALTLRAARLILHKKHLHKKFLSKPSGMFLLSKAQIERKELQYIDFDEKILLSTALSVAQKVGGTYICPIDLFASYLLLSESTTHLLFNKKLKEEDLLQIVKWARKYFPYEEIRKQKRAFRGAGIGDDWVSGWTIETKKYTRDFTWEALQTDSKLMGRDEEFKLLCAGLLKKENSNVLLVGEEGVGKRHMVGVLAERSFEGVLSKELNHKKILEFMAGLFMAGVTSRADLEVRLQQMMDELIHAGNVILYISNFQDILGATSFGIDISQALLPYLQNGSIPAIASMTSGNYKTYVEENPIREIFETVKVDEPSSEIVTAMLFEKADDLERTYKITISYRAVAASLSLAPHYLPDSFLPGSAVTLLSDASNMLSQAHNYSILTEEDIVKKTEETRKIKVGAPDDKEKKLLLDLETELHKKVIGQDEAIKAIADALRRVRSGIANQNKPVSFLFLGPTGVGKTETAKSLASIYFGSEASMMRFDMSEYSSPESIDRLIGSRQGERGELTDKIHDNPFSLILLDEYEKAHPDVLNLFLQILDDGRLTDGRGRTVPFMNTFIIATSNAGSEFIREHLTQQGVPIDFQQQLLNELQRQGIFKPELLNRFDSVVAFKPLDHNALIQVANLLLEQTKAKLKKQDIDIVFDQRIIENIIQKGANSEFGARPLRRYIQDSIEDVIAKKLLDGTLQRGARITVGVDTQGMVQVS